MRSCSSGMVSWCGSVFHAFSRLKTLQPQIKRLLRSWIFQNLPLNVDKGLSWRQSTDGYWPSPDSWLETATGRLRCKAVARGNTSKDGIGVVRPLIQHIFWLLRGVQGQADKYSQPARQSHRTTNSVAKSGCTDWARALFGLKPIEKNRKTPAQAFAFASRATASCASSRLSTLFDAFTGKLSNHSTWRGTL